MQHGADACTIGGTVRHPAGERVIQVRIQPPEKSLALFGKTITIDEFVGQLHVTAFTQAHLAVIRGSPADRRAFLDRGMMTIYPGHVRAVVNYTKALKHRNRLLCEGRIGTGALLNEEQLDSWDQILAGEGAQVIWNRLQYVDELKAHLPEGLFGDEHVRMQYLCSVKGSGSSVGALREGFGHALKQARAADARAGHTSIGPHREDVRIFVDSRMVSTFGSAGQQRSALLALYFAQLEVHKCRCGFYPIFLVDDVEAELDDERLKRFISYLGERTQTLLTTAKQKALPEMSGEISRLAVESGGIIREIQPEI